MPTIFRWISPAAAGSPGRFGDGHFFAAEWWAHVISPPPAASRADMKLSAGVAKLVDALDLGSSDESCGGSSPSARTKRCQRLRETSKGRFRKGMGRRTTDAAALPRVEQIYNVRP